MDALEDLYNQYFAGLLGGVNWPMVVAFVLVTGAIGWVLTRLTAWLRAGAIPILIALIIVVVLLVLAGYGISISE